MHKCWFWFIFNVFHNEKIYSTVYTITWKDSNYCTGQKPHHDGCDLLKARKLYLLHDMRDIECKHSFYTLEPSPKQRCSSLVAHWRWRQLSSRFHFHLREIPHRCYWLPKTNTTSEIVIASPPTVPGSTKRQARTGNLYNRWAGDPIWPPIEGLFFQPQSVPAKRGPIPALSQ